MDIGHRMIYQDLKGLGAGVGYSARYYKQNDAYYFKPEIGDQIFFGDMDHTGIVVDIVGDYVKTVEGNYGNKVGQRTIRYNDSFVAGYGRPNWSLVASIKEPEKPKEEEKPVETPIEKPVEKPVEASGVYTVVAGDTLSAIAKKYGTTVAILVSLNGISNPNLIYVGQQIKLPGKEKGQEATTPVQEKPVEEVKPTTPVQEPQKEEQIIYIVKSGDTLSYIAKKYDVTVDALVKANNIANPNLIYVNQKIVIPSKTQTVVQQPVAEAPKEEKQKRTYTVKAGDTLWKIAQKYDTTVAALASLNHIKDVNLILVGQVLQID